MIKISNRLVRSIPNFLWPIKKFLITQSINKKGNNVKISSSSIIIYPLVVEIGNDVFIGSNFYCSAVAGVSIGDRVMLGANISIIGGDHKFNDPNINMRFANVLGENNRIFIQNDVWIGHGTTILKSGFLAEGSIYGAHSIITNKTKPYSIYIGQPARFIKPRFDSYKDLINYLEMMKNNYDFVSQYSLEELKLIYV